MAVIPVSNVAEPGVTNADRSREMETERVGELASGFKVDAVLAIYANQHAANYSVKKFARSFGKRSAEFNARLKELSIENGFSLPVEIIPDHEKSLGIMKGKRKALFDGAYLNFMAKHLELRKTAVKWLEENSQTPELSDFSKEYAAYLNDAAKQITRLASA